MLTTAITERHLAGARDVASVIDARIRQRVAGIVPLPQQPWSDRIPQVPPDHQQFVADLVQMMDERKERIGEHATEHEPEWATRALGPIPADPLDRLAWQREAASNGAYRELSGFDPARRLAIAADNERRRRHPELRLEPLRSAEPEPVTEQAELVLAPGKEIAGTSEWITDLAAQRKIFAEKLAERKSLMIPAEDPDYQDLGQAFPVALRVISNGVDTRMPLARPTAGRLAW